MADNPNQAKKAENAKLAVRAAGFTEEALKHPRDELALKLLCAFNNVDPATAPEGWGYFPNPQTAAAWGRVAAAARAHVENEAREGVGNG